MSDKKYFAASDSKECASVLFGKAQTFFTVMQRNAYLEKLKDMWLFYYGIFGNAGAVDEHQVSFGGEQGELVNIPINHFRNIARHIYNMITAERPTMEARAINTDYKSMSQTLLANNILDYYMREKGIEAAIHRAAEMAVVMGCGYVKLEWNATAGEPYDIDENNQSAFNYEGELEVTNLSAFDVVMDGTKESFTNEWLLVRSYQNRYNLAAKYPEHKESILAAQSKDETNKFRINLFSNDNTDDIPIYEFYHKKTEALPDGRYMLFLDTSTILLDTKMVYREIPIYRISYADIVGTPYAYTDMFDIYPLQEAINSLHSTILTNQTALGVQNLWVQKGSDFNIESLVGGMNLVESETKPESIQLTQNAPEIFNYLQMLEKTAETLSGVSSVIRGNPESSLRSGTALALVQSMGLQYMSGFQKNYVNFIEHIGTSLLNILKDFANTPKLMALVGRNNRQYLSEFTGDMIKDINRVIVDVGNPLSKTTAGRVQMAEQLLQMKLLKTPQQYFAVLNTGRLDTTYESDMSELMLIKRENETFLDGQSVPTTMLDQHRMHIMEHKGVISDPSIRQNPLILQAVLSHIQEHINHLRTADPDILQLIGETPLNPPQQAGQPIPPENMPPVHAVESSPMGDVMNGMQEGAQAPASALPGLPTVNAALLPNPSIEPKAR
jgi:hypothetical protein